MTLTFCALVALLPVFLYAVMHAQSYTKQLLNVSEHLLLICLLLLNLGKFDNKTSREL